MSGGAKLQVRVAEVVEVNELIKRFRFVSRDGSDLPAFSGGAHTVVEMDDHGTLSAAMMWAGAGRFTCTGMSFPGWR